MMRCDDWSRQAWRRATTDEKDRQRPCKFPVSQNVGQDWITGRGRKQPLTWHTYPLNVARVLWRLEFGPNG